MAKLPGDMYISIYISIYIPASTSTSGSFLSRRYSITITLGLHFCVFFDRFSTMCAGRGRDPFLSIVPSGFANFLLFLAGCHHCACHHYCCCRHSVNEKNHKELMMMVEEEEEEEHQHTEQHLQHPPSTSTMHASSWM